MASSSLSRFENRMYKKVFTELDEENELPVVVAANMNVMLKEMLRRLGVESFYFDKEEK